MRFKMYKKTVVLFIAILIAIAIMNYNQESPTDQNKSTPSTCAIGTPVRNLPLGKPLHIVLLGKTGHGKSATANSIFGEKRFESHLSLNSVTTKCKMEIGIIGGREISLVDTPGTMDTTHPMEALQEIGTSIALLPQGVDAFVIVLNIQIRITQEEIMTITMLKKIFGDDVLLKYGVLVFTHGDIFMQDNNESKQTFQEYIKSQAGYIQNLLEECGNRIALIDNQQKDSGCLRDQVIQIIALIDERVAINNGTMYTNAMFAMAQRKLEEEQMRLDKAKAEIDRKIQEDMDTIKKQLKDNQEEEIKKIKKEFEKKFSDLQIEVDNKAHTVGKDIARTIGDNIDCFPPDALVTLDDGRTITIADLRIGHKVLSAAASGALEYSEIYFLAHLNPNITNEYINLSSSKQNLKLTPQHHIYIVRNGHVKTIAAREVKIGDSMLVLNKEMFSLLHEPVTKISKSTEIGVYAPITMSGSIIVNNVLASCYVDLVPPRYSHRMLWPLRQLYRLSPSLTALINAEGKNGMPIWVNFILDDILA